MSNSTSAAATGLPALTRRDFMGNTAALVPVVAVLSPPKAWAASPAGKGTGRIFGLIEHHGEVVAAFPGNGDEAREIAWNKAVSAIETQIGATPLAGLDEATAALRFVIKDCEINAIDDWGYAALDNIAAALADMQAGASGAV